MYIYTYPPTLLASSGWERSEQPYYLYFPPPSTVLPYYRTASLPYYRKDLTTVKTVRQFRTMTDDRLRIVFRARTGESYGTTSGGRFFCWRLKLLWLYRYVEWDVSKLSIQVLFLTEGLWEYGIRSDPIMHTILTYGKLGVCFSFFHSTICPYCKRGRWRLRLIWLYRYVEWDVSKLSIQVLF